MYSGLWEGEEEEEEEEEEEGRGRVENCLRYGTVCKLTYK